WITSFLGSLLQAPWVASVRDCVLVLAGVPCRVMREQARLPLAGHALLPVLATRVCVCGGWWWVWSGPGIGCGVCPLFSLSTAGCLLWVACGGCGGCGLRIV